MKISFITLINNSNKYPQQTFTQKIKTSKDRGSSVQESRWSYSSHVMANKIDYKNNPKEHEYDVMLGKKIERLRSITQKLGQRIEQETEAQKKEALNKKLEYFNELKSVYVNELTERHLPFALKMAHEYRYMGMPFNETLSAANVGLMAAAERYSPSKNPEGHFITYAKHWIFQQIQRDSSRDKQVRLPSNALARYNKIKNAEFELKETTGRQPSSLEIADYCGFSERTVNMLLRHAGFKETSLNAQMTNDDDSKSLENVIPDKNAQKSTEDKMVTEDLVYMRYIIEKYLTPREKDVIKMRYRLDEEQKPGEFLRTLEEISQEMGLTRERIRQIETLAIQKIKRGKEIEEGNKLKNQPVPTPVIAEPPKLPVVEKPKRKPLNSFILLNYFSEALTKDLDSETKNKVLTKLNSYSGEEFQKIIENTSSEKRREVLLLKYSRANNPMGILQNNNKIAKILGINYAGVGFREKEGLNDVRRFLIEGPNLNYVFLRESIISDIKNVETKEKIIKRLEKASDSELKSIMNNLLSKKELSVVNERYGLNTDTSLGMRVKSIKETAQNLGLDETAVHFLTAKATRRLKEYFSKPPTKNSNLSVFAKAATKKITDIEKRKEAIRVLMKLDEDTIEEFLKKILTPEEISVTMIRYHLKEYDNARKTLVDKNTLAKKLGFKTRSKANKLEQKVFEKIKNYFENGYTSNRTVFAKKVCETIEDETIRQETESKITTIRGYPH